MFEYRDSVQAPNIRSRWQPMELTVSSSLPFRIRASPGQSAVQSIAVFVGEGSSTLERVRRLPSNAFAVSVGERALEFVAKDAVIDCQYGAVSITEFVYSGTIWCACDGRAIEVAPLRRKGHVQVPAPVVSISS